jgi:ribosomal protein S27AE
MMDTETVCLSCSWMASRPVVCDNVGHAQIAFSRIFDKPSTLPLVSVKREPHIAYRIKTPIKRRETRCPTCGKARLIRHDSSYHRRKQCGPCYRDYHKTMGRRRIAMGGGPK